MACACKASAHVGRVVKEYGDGSKSGASLPLYIKGVILYILMVPVIPVFLGYNVVKGLKGGTINIDKLAFGWVRR